MYSTFRVAEGAPLVAMNFRRCCKTVRGLHRGGYEVAGGANGPLAWSTWKVPGEGDYQGFLSVLGTPSQNRKDLHVQVESAALQAGGTNRCGT